MTRAGIFETIVGVFVIAVAAYFLVFAYQSSDRNLGRGAYSLGAVFGKVDGVTVGSEVRIAGVKVGSVTKNDLDTQTYEARLTLAIANGVAVPEDSIAKIVSDGVLGGAHVAIEPGASELALKEGEVISITQGSIDLVGLVVQAFTNNATSSAKSDSNDAEDNPAVLKPTGDDQ